MGENLKINQFFMQIYIYIYAVFEFFFLQYYQHGTKYLTHSRALYFCHCAKGMSDKTVAN